MFTLKEVELNAIANWAWTLKESVPCHAIGGAVRFPFSARPSHRVNLLLTHCSIPPEISIEMSSTRSNINITNLPRFNGRNYQQWSDKMTGIFLIARVMGIIDGSITQQTLAEPTEPPMPTGTTTAADWTAYGAKINRYATLLAEWRHVKNKYSENNETTHGIFSSSLDIGIWEQVKEKSAKEIWDWLKTKYGKEAFVEVLDDFRYLRDLKIDLSDPNPQLANFMHHYQRLPMEGTPKKRIVSESMACLILLSNLPLATGNVGSTSLYQRMLEEVV